MPTYSGGLGVLAGDTLRAAADLGIPMIGVTLVHREGYFRQHLDAEGSQSETAATFEPEKVLTPADARVSVEIEGRRVSVRAWRYDIRGIADHRVPVYLLDTDLTENAPQDRALTHRLYGGDERHRLAQEVVLGLGGVAMLEALSPARPTVFHMNEGHSALLTLALLREQVRGDLRGVTAEDRDAIRERCGSFFNTQRMLSQYLANAYLRRSWD